MDITEFTQCFNVLWRFTWKVLSIYYTKKIEYVCMCVCLFVCLFVCSSFIGGRTVGWNEMKLGMSDPWDMRTDMGGSSSRSKVTGSRSPGNFNFSISSDRDGTNAIRQIIKMNQCHPQGDQYLAKMWTWVTYLRSHWGEQNCYPLGATPWGISAYERFRW